MGCDGGTIPKRDELVRKRKKPEKKDQDADRQAKWKNCSLSQEPLEKPIMACQLGRLYNKEAVLEALLERSAPSHLRGLKDLKELRLTENPTFRADHAEKGDAYKDTMCAQYYCPVTALEMNGKYKFCFIWSCGCVLSEKALKEVPSETCHKCGKKFTEEDVHVLNGSEEEVEAQRQRMAAAQELAKKAKKEKRKAENGEGPVPAKIHRPEAGASTSTAKEELSKNGTAMEPSKNGTAVEPAKNGTSVPKVGAKALSVDKTSASQDARKVKSIQDDPSASSAYKSLFTSCDTAKRQPKAHWVTYNPCYN